MFSSSKKFVPSFLMVLLGVVLVAGAHESSGVLVWVPSPENSAEMAPRALPRSSTLSKTMAWVSGIEAALQKAIKGFRSVKVAGNINEQLGYVAGSVEREGRQYGHEDHLIVLNKKTGVILFSARLTVFVKGDQVWPNKIDGFSFQVSPAEQLWATVISAAREIGTRNYEEGLGYMRVILCDRGSVLWVSPPISTCRLGVSMFDGIFSFCVLARALVGDVNGDGYRDLILWRREYAPIGPGQPVELSGWKPDHLFPWSLKNQEALVYEYLPAEGKYSLEPTPVGLELDDRLWYPGGFEEARNGGKRCWHLAWAGCDDSQLGFSRSLLYREFVSEDETRPLFRWRPASATSTVSVPIVPLADGKAAVAERGVEEPRESPEGAQEQR